MNVRRETPSILELCHRFNKSKDQEVASNLNDSLESERGPGIKRLRSGQFRSKAYESKVSQVTMEKYFPHVKNINELRFSSVETRSSQLVFYDSYDSDTVCSSEEDCSTLAGPFQAQNGYVKANNPQAARLYGEESQPPSDERGVFRKIRHRGLGNTGSFLPRVVGHQRHGNLTLKTIHVVKRTGKVVLTTMIHSAMPQIVWNIHASERALRGVTQGTTKIKRKTEVAGAAVKPAACTYTCSKMYSEMRPTRHKVATTNGMREKQSYHQYSS